MVAQDSVKVWLRHVGSNPTLSTNIEVTRCLISDNQHSVEEERPSVEVLLFAGGEKPLSLITCPGDGMAVIVASEAAG